MYFRIYNAEKATTPRATHTASRPRAETRRVRAQQRCLGPGPRTKATSRVRAEPRTRGRGAHPKPSEAPTHFGPPRAVRAACRNLVKHQRILGIPNLSATCGVRPLLAMSVRYLRCQSAIRNVRPQPAVSVRDRRCVGRACKNRHEHTLAKTVTNTRAGSVLFSIPGL